MGWFRREKSFKAIVAKVLQSEEILNQVAEGLVKEGYILEKGKIVKEEEDNMKKKGYFGSPPMIDRSKSVGSVIDPTWIAEDIMRDVRRLKGGVKAEDRFKTVVAENSDLNEKQIEEIKEELKKYGVIIEG